MSASRGKRLEHRATCGVVTCYVVARYGVNPTSNTSTRKRREGILQALSGAQFCYSASLYILTLFKMLLAIIIK